MGVNDYDMNFIVGHDLGNAVYSQWLKHLLTGTQRTRMLADSPSVNEDRAGGAVEVCLALLDFAALPI